jgi:hypothetical protein
MYSYGSSNLYSDKNKDRDDAIRRNFKVILAYKISFRPVFRFSPSPFLLLGDHKFLACFPYLEKKNKSRLMISPCCLCVCIASPINFWMPEPIFMKLGMYIIVLEPISTPYFINPSQQSMRLDVIPSIVPRQVSGKNVTMATNTHATKEELLAASFSVRSVSYEGTAGD